MNAANRTALEQVIRQALETAIEQAITDGLVDVPLLGYSTYHHMAITAVNVLEALEDVEEYIGEQLPKDIREGIGI